MADNYLERQQEALEQRKAGKRVLTPAQRKRFYTRPVVTKTHEQQQAEIAQLKTHEQQQAEIAQLQKNDKKE